MGNQQRHLAILAIVGFGVATLAILTAPLVLGDGYDWVTMSVSRSAAQQTTGAWLGRTGLLISGLSVLLVCIVRAEDWGPWATAPFTLFGLFWMFTATFSTESWIESVPRNDLENVLHSVFATAMAVICIGALVLLATGRCGSLRWQLATVGLIAAATLLPLGALLLPAFAGVFQRIMFLITYLWFSREALFAVTRQGTHTEATQSL